MLTLCVTVASYNPEVLRGMQILVSLLMHVGLAL